jgi:hypothetical protein
MGVASSWNDMYKEKLLSIGEGPEYKPFHDLRSVPGTGRLKEQGRKSRKGLYSGPFPM